MSRLNKSTVDVSAIFLTFVALVGDIEKTAAARNLDPEFVRKLAESEDWNSKIRAINRLTADGRPGDFERSQNRAVAFVQAWQTGQLLERLISHLTSLSDADLVETLTPRSKDGTPGPVSAKVFSDLTAALEKTHFLRYVALCDSVKEREERAIEDGNQLGANALHQAVINALNGVKTPIKAETLIAESVDSTVKQLTVGTEAPPA